MKRREIPVAPDPRKSETLTLPDGRELELGDEFTVKTSRETGRYTFRYGYHGDQATCWGPVTSKQPMWRTFRAADITRIHRTTKRKVTP